MEQNQTLIDHLDSSLRGETSAATQAMIDNDRALQRQITEALERLDTGKYGICERCGKEIGAKRLEALPYVTLCIDDQELIERGQAQ